MEMGAKIDIISRELIKPSSPTPNERRNLKLSLLDQAVPSGFIPLLFFYQKQSKILDPSCKTTSLPLKQSLSESLTKFYPFAGKLNPDLLSFDCDDSGVLFVEAKVDAPLSESVQNASFKSFGEFLPFPAGGGDGDDELLLGAYPRNEILFGVQITWFECGSSAIGVCASHRVADFASLVIFMNSWAVTRRGESLFMKKNDPDFEIGKNLFPPLEFSPAKMTPVTAGKGKMISRRFVFNKKKLTELKKQAISSSAVKDPTRVEVVTAFLWKQFMKVARTKQELFTFKLWHAVNLRSRMSSLATTVSEDMLIFPSGNLVILSPASFTASEVDPDQNDEDDLVWLARTAIRKVNDDYVFDVAVPFLKSLMGTRKIVEQLKQQQPTHYSFFTSWCRFSTYEVDFGWGKPVWVGPAGTGQFGGVILTDASSEEDDGIEAQITLLEDELALLPDEILSLAATHYF